LYRDGVEVDRTTGNGCHADSFPLRSKHAHAGLAQVDQNQLVRIAGGGGDQRGTSTKLEPEHHGLRACRRALPGPSRTTGVDSGPPATLTASRVPGPGGGATGNGGGAPAGARGHELP
jgi:hypothetical protein